MSIKKIIRGSKINIIKIKIGDERLVINLSEELMVKESELDDSLASAPAHYSYLSAIYSKVLRKKLDLAVEKDAAYSRAYMYFKSSINEETNRPYNDDMAKAEALQDPEYLGVCNQLNEETEKANILYSATKAYEFKINLMQTISANNRKNS